MTQDRLAFAEDDPSQSETVRLKHLARINPSKSEIDDVPPDTTVSFVPLEGFGTSGAIESSEEKPLAEVYDGYTYFRESDIAIAKITPSFENGKGAICKGLENGIGFGTTELHILRPRENTDTGFLWYVLRAKPFMDEAETSMRGVAGQKRLKSEFVETYRVPELPLDEQRDVADFLDRRTARIDALVAKQKRLLDLLDEKRQAFVTRTITAGLDFTVAKKSTEIGWFDEIPAHWDTTRVRFVARLESGHTPSKSNEEYWTDTDVPWVSLADSGRLRKNDRITETEHYTNQKGLNNSSAHILPTGTVVFTRDATVGLCAILDRPMAVAQHLVGWVCGSKILPEYLLNVFESMDQEFDLLTRGSTISTIGMPDIRSLKTPLPPVEEQREIVEHIQNETEQLSNLIDNVEEAIDLLEEKRQALITAAVTGQIDVTEARGETHATHR
ncbi:restriction endonuclease subunit S [Halococcus saccharolyticus]|uniref:Restriction modification system DNA specificity subunit n=1 Tax=Halococcus saccharolyticus DSM 5350 TaxID=1227455 RepID=M0MCP1_9EURY|nr:restriction endonuclease subunit S [Halococcus saccharolyticus]EMA43113.1 restriction modification system DNA specificity subunit [Halococcus saccharolyticus DSM 5350]